MSEPTLPDAHPTLGARQLHARKVVEGGSGKRFAGGALLAISVLLFLGMGGAGLLVGIGGALQGDAAAGGITATAFLCVGLAAAIVPGAIGALLLRAGRAITAHVEEVAVYSSGVMTKTGEDASILHWGEVRAFKRSPAQGRISVLTTDLPLLFFRLEADGDRAIEVRGYPELGAISKYNTLCAKQSLNPILLKGPLFIEMPDAAAFLTVAGEMRASLGGAE